MVQLPAPLIRSSPLTRWIAVFIALFSHTLSAQAPPAGPELWDGIIIDPNTQQVTAFIIDEEGRLQFEFFKNVPLSDEGMPSLENLEVPDAEATLKIRDLRYISDLYSSATGDSLAAGFVSVTYQSDRLRLMFDQGVPLWGAILASGGLLLIGGVGVGLFLTRRERRRVAAEAAERQRAFHAREAERSRLARELHDGPLQDVHALRMLSGTSDPESMDREAARIARELRAIAEGLRPPALGRFGLSAALSAHANRVKDRYPNVAIRLQLDEDGVEADALPDLVRSSLFRVVQESITNAIEHGAAGRLQVALRLPSRSTDGEIQVEVVDDGSGFAWADGAPDLDELADGGHFGLVGMHERAAAIGGRLELLPIGLDGKGATVRVSVPDMRETSASSSSKRRRPTLA